MPLAHFLEPKVTSKWGLNRSFDAEALRKPPGSVLERPWTLLEPKKTNLESLLGALGALLEAENLQHKTWLSWNGKRVKVKNFKHWN